MTALSDLLFGYVMCGVLSFIVAMVAVDEIRAIADLPREARVVVVVALVVLGPLTVAALVVWSLCKAAGIIGRGSAQLYRIVRPAKAELPRAEVRR